MQRRRCLSDNARPRTERIRGLVRFVRRADRRAGPVFGVAVVRRFGEECEGSQHEGAGKEDGEGGLELREECVGGGG